MGLDVSLMRTKWISYDKGATWIIENEEVFEWNITHNLGAMAERAGVYDACWRPHEQGYKQAKDIIPILSQGLKSLTDEAEAHRYSLLNPSNGWGDHAGLVKFISNYLAACRQFPDARIEVSR